MIVLDTNVLSELMRPHPDDQVRAWLLHVSEIRLAISAVTIAEIEYGLRRLPDGLRQSDLRDRFARFVTGLTVLPLNEDSASYAGMFRAMRDELGLPSTPSDMMIAGIAMQAGANLATRNIRDFEKLPVVLLNPWATIQADAEQ